MLFINCFQRCKKMAEEGDKNLFTPRKGPRFTTNSGEDGQIFLIDLEEGEEDENAEKFRTNGFSEDEKSGSCDKQSLPKNCMQNAENCKRQETLFDCSNVERDKFSSNSIEVNCSPLNESFTICEKCLSNRKKEFPLENLSMVSCDADSDNLNNSKEICVCVKHELSVNDENNVKFINNSESGSALKDAPVTRDISSLPDEIMLKIFSYFSLPDLCRYVAPVCLTWLQYARDGTLWEVISHDEIKNVPNDLLVKVVTSWCSLLRNIDFKCRSDMPLTEFMLIFESCPLIESISFAFCSQIDDEIIGKCSKYFHNLHYINFEGCLVSDASIIHLFGKPIHGINLSHCTMITDEGVIFLSRNFTNLTHINLDGIQWISHDSIVALVDSHGYSLQEIILDGAELTDDSVRLLSRCQNIRNFSLSFCDSLADNSLEWLGQLKKLNSLQLKKGANFSTNGMLNLLHNLKTLEGKGLLYLNLAECTALSDECLHVISESCPNLRILNLSWCWEVTDDGINFIFDSCHNINELYLCGLHELYGIPFRRTQSELPKLTFLDLRQCNKTSDDLLADLANQIKTLKILNYYGDEVKPSLNYWNLESKCSPDHFHHINFSR